jgi:hypothetical protein
LEVIIFGFFKDIKMAFASTGEMYFKYFFADAVLDFSS